jgi:hypothetical protein
MVSFLIEKPKINEDVVSSYLLLEKLAKAWGRHPFMSNLLCLSQRLSMGEAGHPANHDFPSRLTPPL